MNLSLRSVLGGVRVTDAAVAVTLVGVGQLDVWARLFPDGYEGSRTLNAALAALAAAGAVVVRRWPLPAVMWTTAVVCLTRPFFAHDSTILAGGFLALIVVTASTAVHEDQRGSLIALAVALAGLAIYLSAEPALRSPASYVGDGLFIALPWLAARLVRARTQQAVRLSADLEQARAEQAAREQEILAEERARIARELHDVVAHSVSVMVLNIGAARLHLTPGQEKARQPLAVAEETGRQALTELRRLLGVLREVPDLPAASASPQPSLGDLDRLAEAMAATGLAVHLERRGRARPLPPALELSAYRIIQEGLTNALKHGHATRAQVTVDFGETSLAVDITDNGTGNQAGLPVSGHGLIGVRERALLFGGRVDAGPRRPGGWRLYAELPIRAGQQAAAVGGGR